MVGCINDINNCPVAPLHRPAAAHKFIVNIILAPLAKKMAGCSPDISSGDIVLAVDDEWCAFILATGDSSLTNLSWLYEATSSLL